MSFTLELRLVNHPLATLGDILDGNIYYDTL